MTFKEFDSCLHNMRRDEVPVIRQNRQLPLLQQPIGCNPFLHRAIVSPVSGQDEGRRCDLMQILDSVAQRLGESVEYLGEMCLPVSGPLRTIVVRFHQFEHGSHLF